MLTSFLYFLWFLCPTGWWQCGRATRKNSSAIWWHKVWARPTPLYPLDFLNCVFFVLSFPHTDMHILDFCLFFSRQRPIYELAYENIFVYTYIIQIAMPKSIMNSSIPFIYMYMLHIYIYIYIYISYPMPVHQSNDVHDERSKLSS